jgi:hypothetical protein
MYVQNKYQKGAIMKKKETFQMRMSAETRRQLNQLKDIYQVSAGSVVCMLIADKMREIEIGARE